MQALDYQTTGAVAVRQTKGVVAALSCLFALIVNACVFNFAEVGPVALDRLYGSSFQVADRTDPGFRQACYRAAAPQWFAILVSLAAVVHIAARRFRRRDLAVALLGLAISLAAHGVLLRLFIYADVPPIAGNVEAWTMLRAQKTPRGRGGYTGCLAAVCSDPHSGQRSGVAHRS